jgi:exonuclease SbcC
MILKSIALRNIRSYSSQKIDFPEGSVLLAGDIGSGKSSILHSIEFALFGARRDSISGEALLRKGEKEGEVELSFDIRGQPVTIMRRLKRARDSVAQEAGFIIIDGKKIEGTATELKARVLDLLGYPKELLTKSKSLVYRYTVYTPQEQMKQIIMESDELRIDTLRKVFGIDRYKRIAENTALYVRKIKEMKKELAGMMVGIDEKKKELKKKKDELAKIDLARKGMLPLLDTVRKSKEQKKEEIAVLENDINRLNDMRKHLEVHDARLIEIVKQRGANRSELESLDAQIAQLKKKLESIFLEEKQYPPLEQLEKDIKEKEQEANRLSTKRTELVERNSQIKQRAEELSKDIGAKTGKASLSQEKEALYKELLEQTKDKEIVTSNISGLSLKLKDSEAVIAELNANKKNSEELKQKVSSLDTCPTCMQDVSEVHKRSISEQEDRKLKKITAELETLSTEKTRIEAMLKEHNTKMDALLEKERRLAAVKVEMSNFETLKSELDAAKKQHAELAKERSLIVSALERLDMKVIDSINRSIDEKKRILKEMNEYNLQLKEKKHNLAMMAEKEQRKDGLDKLQEKLKQEVKQINSDKLKINEDISRLSPAEAQFKRRKEDLDSILDEEKGLEIRMGELNKVIEGIETQIDMLDKDIDAKEKAGKRLDHLNSVQEWLEKMFINLMSVMEKQIMARVHTQFSELFTTWFNLLIEDEAISVRIDDTFSPIITQNGHDISIEHLSGGEKTSIALAYRLALNKVINDIISTINTSNLIILDEPTDGFSSEQLDNVRNVLDELNLKQIIIVSHESKIESFVNHVIRIHKNEHISRVIA